MKEYEVIRPFRWHNKNLKRSDRVTPQTAEEAARCNLIMKSGYLVPVLNEEAADILEATGARYIRIKGNKVNQDEKN